MDVKIENIIEKIKKEGIEGAQKASDDILANANKEASDIVSNAKKEAEKLIQDAQNKADAFQKNSTLAIQQAARDGELLLKGRIQALFDNVFKQEVADAMNPDFLKSLILKLVENWGKDAEAEITVSQSDIKQLEKLLAGGLKKKTQAGITFKASPDFSHGFKIGLKGSDVYYDFSDESIAEVLRNALNTRLKEIVDVKNG